MNGVMTFSAISDPLRWTTRDRAHWVIEMLRLREEVRNRLERSWASRDVKDAHDRFRRCYLGNGKTPSLCRYMEHVEPHLHAPRRLRRIGHLPMMTMKELPE